MRIGFLKKVLAYKNLPELILVIAGLVSGLCLFQDYGASWDEPDLYKYASQSLKAYSIQDRAQGQFNLDSLLGPDNLRLYGPAYLVMGQVIVNAFDAVLPAILTINLWHFVNYLMFVLGVIIFYRLLKRWFKVETALIAALLFACQPVLFGISWIDPKDIPFMVLFILSIYSGLRLIDNIKASPKSTTTITEAEGKTVSSKKLRILEIITGIFALITLTGWVFNNAIIEGLKQTILGMNSRQPGDLIYKAFSTFAKNNASIPLEAYAGKAAALFSHTLTLLSMILAVPIIVAISLRFYPAWLSRVGMSVKDILHDVFFDKKTNIFSWKMAEIFLFGGLVLGLTTSTRVLGPLAGLLIAIELFRRIQWKSIPLILIYAILAIIITMATWPYLWENTASRFSEVFFHMAENPVGVGVLFRGVVYDSKELPVEYLPWLMAVTLTIPALILCITGLFSFIGGWIKKSLPAETWIMAAWFVVPFGYVLIKRPPMYDNYRHFLFILPALFFFSALVIEKLMTVKWVWLKTAMALILLVPGIAGIIQCHPYEYSYYNELTGGMKGAAGKYEVDYWLTCYRDLTLKTNTLESEADNIFAAFMPDLVRYYADKRFQVFKANDPAYPPGSLVFLPLRRQGLTLYSELPVTYDVISNGVTLCAARRVSR